MFHEKNKHQGKYNFKELIECSSALEEHVFTNEYGSKTINFFEPLAVKALNKALLFSYYKLRYWDIPAGYLCPPIPGRAEYIHRIAEALDIEDKKGINCLDIGTGANCIYPLLGTKEYNWSFVGSDIDPISVASAQKIIEKNALGNKIEIRHQMDKHHFFQGIVKEKEHFYLSMCNPPFHSSEKEANRGTARKLKNLGKENNLEVKLNFGGQKNELWCKGGEALFIKKMIKESVLFAENITWFSSLVSKSENLKNIYKVLKRVGVSDVKTIEMAQGNKVSRIVAWRF